MGDSELSAGCRGCLGAILGTWLGVLALAVIALSLNSTGRPAHVPDWLPFTPVVLVGAIAGLILGAWKIRGKR